MAIGAESELALWVSWALLVASARLFRSKLYAIASGIFLGTMLLIVTGLGRQLNGPAALALYFGAALALVYGATLLRPRLRPRWFRTLVSVPSMAFLGGALLAFPWAIASAFGAEPLFLWLPFAFGAVGVVQVFATSPTPTEVAMVVDESDVGELRRYRVDGKGNGTPSPLAIVQITDPHLGPFMSVARLRAVCERAIKAAPDLVFITGDLMTMESQDDQGALERALEPLRSLQGRVFACMGNHDYEAPETIRSAFAATGIALLVDDIARVDTAQGPVEVIGADYYFRDHRQRIEALMNHAGALGDAVRILLLHNPAHFREVPSGSVDLVLSGHTHGGQLGLVSFGLSWTLWNALAKTPDHGFWAHGKNRLYVHRGTGHYGFPLRIGVPREESILRIRFARKHRV